jgi:hypothetical protein
LHRLCYFFLHFASGFTRKTAGGTPGLSADDKRLNDSVMPCHKTAEVLPDW